VAGNAHSWLLVLRRLTLAGLCFSVSAGAAEIYVLTGEDGSVSLSNVRVDIRYTMLMTDEAGAPGRVLRSERRMGLRDPSAKSRFDQVVEQTARTYGLESALLHAVISVESGYNPRAISPKGASGLMQLMPNTALRYGVANVLDPVQNLQGGAQYLRDLLKLFNSDLKLVLAAYNAGENAVVRYGNQIPPFRETAGYVPRVLGYYQQYRANGHELSAL
jgi:soluble lytic murein transglycosylase-like protein